MCPVSSTESYPAFARIGLRENPGKNLNQYRRTPVVEGGRKRCFRFSTVNPKKKMLLIVVLATLQGSVSSLCQKELDALLAKTDRLYTATCTHTLLPKDVHIRTDHVRYTLRYLHCFIVVSCPHPSDSALNGILSPNSMEKSANVNFSTGYKVRERFNRKFSVSRCRPIGLPSRSPDFSPLDFCNLIILHEVHTCGVTVSASGRETRWLGFESRSGQVTWLRFFPGFSLNPIRANAGPRTHFTGIITFISFRR
ncbi:hypothetical protein ANN_09818 [Periplaneta americana]|uniref:Uncharacterized protein n=1 Tax=Periplaneta americana TaxID=6978 RepID=A0ABQ8TQZ5_PERAM|nr:hypothetical protein ANN_09818 [Periplaneta americana]